MAARSKGAKTFGLTFRSARESANRLYQKGRVYTARDKCLQERVLISLHVCFESDGLLFRCAPAQAAARVGPWAKQDVDSVWGRRRTPVMLGLANLARHPARCVSQLAKPCPGADLHGRR